jgi:hypothetical protein
MTALALLSVVVLLSCCPIYGAQDELHEMLGREKFVREHVEKSTFGSRMSSGNICNYVIVLSYFSYSLTIPS